MSEIKKFSIGKTLFAFERVSNKNVWSSIYTYHVIDNEDITDFSEIEQHFNGDKYYIENLVIKNCKTLKSFDHGPMIVTNLTIDNCPNLSIINNFNIKIGANLIIQNCPQLLKEFNKINFSKLLVSKNFRIELVYRFTNIKRNGDGYTYNLVSKNLYDADSNDARGDLTLSGDMDIHSFFSTNFPHISIRIKKLYIYNNDSLTELNMPYNVKKIAESLYIDKCRNFNGMSKNFKFKIPTVNISQSPYFIFLKNFDKCDIDFIVLSSCENFKSLVGIPKSLKRLKLKNCPGITGENLNKWEDWTEINNYDVKIEEYK